MKKILFLLFLIGCGTEDMSDLDIVGGQKVYRSWYGRVGGCGSTLIAPYNKKKTLVQAFSKWAVSAAHCFGKSKPREVRFGLYQRKDGNGGKPMQTVKVKRIIKHPEWTGNRGYDLALIELESRVKFKPRQLTNATPSDSAKLSAFGFGQTSHPGSAPEFLQGAVFRFNAKATKNSRKEIIRASAPGKAVCFGDSGGPLMYNGKLIATATFTTGNCKAGGQMGFTRVDIPWIKRVVGL